MNEVLSFPTQLNKYLDERLEAVDLTPVQDEFDAILETVSGEGGLEQEPSAENEITAEQVVKALRDAGLAVSQVDGVVLVGGAFIFLLGLPYDQTGVLPWMVTVIVAR